MSLLLNFPGSPTGIFSGFANILLYSSLLDERRAEKFCFLSVSFAAVNVISVELDLEGSKVTL